MAEPARLQLESNAGWRASRASLQRSLLENPAAGTGMIGLSHECDIRNISIPNPRGTKNRVVERVIDMSHNIGFFSQRHLFPLSQQRRKHFNLTDNPLLQHDGDTL